MKDKDILTKKLH